MTFYFFISVVFINLLNAYAVANVTKIEGFSLSRATIHHFCNLAKAENWKRVSKIETVLFFERCTQTVLRAFGKFGERLWRKSFVCSRETICDLQTISEILKL
jgi:hypothetical protein